jgi:hypothetical protein
MLHTDVVFALACGLRVSFYASPLVIAAVLATVCCSHRNQATHVCKQDKQSDRDDFHDNPLVENRSLFLLLITCGALARYAGGFVNCGTQPASEFLRVVVRPKMQKEQPWLFIQHMTMNGCHLDAI